MYFDYEARCVTDYQLPIWRRRSTVFILHFAPSLCVTLSLQSAFYTLSAFYPWSAVCSPQSAYYTDRNSNPRWIFSAAYHTNDYSTRTMSFLDLTIERKREIDSYEDHCKQGIVKACLRKSLDLPESKLIRIHIWRQFKFLPKKASPNFNLSLQEIS